MTRRDRLAYSAGLTHLNVSSGVDGDDAARNTSAQGRLTLRVSPAATLSGRVYAADTFLQLNNSPEAVGALPATGVVPAVALPLSQLRRYETGTPISQLQISNATFIPSANDPDSSRAARFFSGALLWTHQATEKFGYTLTYQGLVTDPSNPNGPAGAGFQPSGNINSEFDGRIRTLSGQFNVQAGRFNSINAGLEFENESFLNRSFPGRTAENSTVDVTQRSRSIFVQDQVRLMDGRLQLAAAFRSQFFSLRDPQFSPAASAPYRGIRFEAPPTAYIGDASIAYFFPSTNTKIRAHAGNGYRAPSLFERFGTFFSSFGYSVFGDPRLRPDRSVAFDAGIDQSFFNSRIRASGTYFYTLYRK